MVKPGWDLPGKGGSDLTSDTRGDCKDKENDASYFGSIFGEGWSIN